MYLYINVNACARAVCKLVLRSKRACVRVRGAYVQGQVFWRCEWRIGQRTAVRLCGGAREKSGLNEQSAQGTEGSHSRSFTPVEYNITCFDVTVVLL